MLSPILVRGITIAGVAAVLLVPIAMIEGKISERRARAESVTAQYAAETNGPQVIAGPLLALTCEETFVEERQIMRAGKAETISGMKTIACPTGYFPPRTLKIAAAMPVENRHRGIYQIGTYRATVAMSGELDWPAPAPSNSARSRTWKKAYVVVGVSDPRGIKSAQSSISRNLVRSKDSALERSFAIQEDLGDYDAARKGSALAFDYQLEIAGISSLHFAPLGDATEIRLKSSWPHPSFGTGWSPDERRIDATGFEAAWRATHLATGGRAFWEKTVHEGKLLDPRTSAGVFLFEPVNVYTLSYRATEYAFLFILFTFTALALAEALAGVRLHAVQYGLVGSAIAVFFLLLIALSEHIAFASAYASAAVACIALLTIYLRHPLGSIRRSATFMALFAALYGGLYVLLSSEDQALLLGSLMVFALLAVVMVATRKIDWTQLSAGMIKMAK